MQPYRIQFRNKEVNTCRKTMMFPDVSWFDDQNFLLRAEEMTLVAAPTQSGTHSLFPSGSVVRDCIFIVLSGLCDYSDRNIRIRLREPVKISFFSQQV
jgi:hypothetical protein